MKNGRPLRETGHKNYKERSSSSSSSHEQEEQTPIKKVVTTTTTPGQKLAVAGARLQPAPIKKMLLKEIYASFRTRIFDQDVGVYQVALLLAKMMHDAETPEKCLGLYKLVLAGASGSGKTETVNHALHLLGFDQGYEYENRHIRLEGGSYTEREQVSALTGAAPGLEGHQNKNSLVHRLLHALDPTIVGLIEEMEALRDKNQFEQYKQKKALLQKFLDEMADLKEPRYIVVFIDEMDKMHKAFFNVLNEFLDKGSISLTTGDLYFRLPNRVALIILCTCNYGAHAIAGMQSRNGKDAAQYITEDMRACGLQDYTLGRIGMAVAYYQFTPEELKDILLRKLDLYLEQSLQQFGQRELTDQNGAKEFMIDEVVKNGNLLGQNIRGSMKHLFANLDKLFVQAANKLRERSETRQDALVLSKESFDSVPKFNAKDDHAIIIKASSRERWANFIHAVLEDPSNLESMLEYRKTERKEPLNALALSVREKRHDQVLAINIYPSFSLVKQDVHTVQNATAKINRLELEVTDVKKKFRKEEKARKRMGKKYESKMHECKKAFTDIRELIDIPDLDRETRKSRVDSIEKQVFTSDSASSSSSDSVEEESDHPTEILRLKEATKKRKRSGGKSERKTKRRRTESPSKSKSTQSHTTSASASASDEKETDEREVDPNEDEEEKLCPCCNKLRPRQTFRGRNPNGHFYDRKKCRQCRV